MNARKKDIRMRGHHGLDGKTFVDDDGEVL
jgi:hypothetical protein